MFNKYKLSKFCSEQRGLLLQLAYSWCHDRVLAEDLLQDALVKALKNISKVKHSKAIKAWFIQIMLNCWRDMLRKKQDLRDIDELVSDDSNSLDNDSHLYEKLTPEESLYQKELQLNVKKALSRLSVKYRTVLTLVDIYGASYTEVSVIIDAPIGTVMSRVSRAREDLRKYLTVEPDLERVVPLYNRPVVRGDE